MGMKMAAMKMASMKMKMAMAKKMMARKMAMKKSVIAKGKRGKSSVFKGTKEKTSGGLKKSDLKKKKASDRARKSKGYNKIMAWSKAMSAARKSLGIKGFCPCGGKTKAGQALLAKTRSLAKK